MPDHVSLWICSEHATVALMGLFPLLANLHKSRTLPIVSFILIANAPRKKLRDSAEGERKSKIKRENKTDFVVDKSLFFLSMHSWKCPQSQTLKKEVSFSKSREVIDFPKAYLSLFQI